MIQEMQYRWFIARGSWKDDIYRIRVVLNVLNALHELRETGALAGEANPLDDLQNAHLAAHSPLFRRLRRPLHRKIWLSIRVLALGR